MWRRTGVGRSGPDGCAVTGIDLADKALAVAKLHALDGASLTTDYRAAAGLPLQRDAGALLTW